MGRPTDPIQAEEAVNLLSTLAIAVTYNTDALNAMAIGDIANAQRFTQMAQAEMKTWLESAKEVAGKYGYGAANG